MKPIDWDQVRVVSWDIDGTLYDLHAFMGALKRNLVRRALRLQWIGLVRDVFRLVRFKIHMDRVRKHPPDFVVGSLRGRDEIGQTMAKIYGEILPELGLLPGVEALLRWVESTGRMQVVFSDYRKSEKLAALEVEHFFAFVFAGEDLGHLKPSPTVFRNIIGELRIQPNELLHIGDRSDTDGAAANEVGYQVAIIGDQFPTAAHLQAELMRISDPSA